MLITIPEFQRFQHVFTAHIRNPEVNTRPNGIEARRMRIYNELVYNNTESALLICFPVLKKVLGRRLWARLLRAFIAKHRCYAPFFRQLPDEFIQFLQTEWSSTSDYPKFILELSHYEWTELVLSISTGVPDWDEVDRAGDLFKQRPILNPVLANLHYSWPVHRIGSRIRIAPKETFLLVFRDSNDQIQFAEINAFTSRLLNLLKTTSYTGQAALEKIIKESCHPAPEVVMQSGLAILYDLRARGVLLGVECNYEKEAIKPPIVN